MIEMNAFEELNAKGKKKPTKRFNGECIV